MVDIYLMNEDYTRRQESEGKFIRFNDRYFLLHFLDKIQVTPEMASAILTIEGGKYTEPNLFASKYYNMRDVSIEYISTGCKTVLNCLAFPDKVFFAEECGKNALKVLLQRKQASIYFDYYLPHFFRGDIAGDFRLFADTLDGRVFKSYNELCRGVRL